MMKVWQADFYKKPLDSNLQQPIWQLLICDLYGQIILTNQCGQTEANSMWLSQQIQAANLGNLPDVIQVFRPQCLGLFELAAAPLNIKIEPTRHTQALKKLLKAQKFSLAIEQLPPQPLPENLWGERWGFASIEASDIENIWSDRPIPILSLPGYLLPLNLKIASDVLIPGIIIYAGKQAMKLALWLEESKPMALNYLPTEIDKSGGLVLEVGLVERWIVATFEDEEMAKGASIYEERKQLCQGLHFLLVQPDDSNMTYTAFWLLQAQL